jgi:hypothetical protein
MAERTPLSEQLEVIERLVKRTKVRVPSALPAPQKYPRLA